MQKHDIALVCSEFSVTAVSTLALSKDINRSEQSALDIVLCKCH